MVISNSSKENLPGEQRRKSVETPGVLPKTRGVALLKPILIAVALFLIAATAWGQIDRGTIQGSVRDQSGLGIPNAKVQVISADTNSALDLETNMEGLYTAPNLPAGNYRVMFQKQGFGSVTREPVEVRPRAEVRVEAQWQVEGPAEGPTEVQAGEAERGH